MNGTRVEWSGQILKPGEYAKLPDGVWYAATPTDLMANLSAHQVTEHDDGTISVSPSILVNAGADNTWHGYLERGVWRTV